MSGTAPARAVDMQVARHRLGARSSARLFETESKPPSHPRYVPESAGQRDAGRFTRFA
jgi:hypothetical protein